MIDKSRHMTVKLETQEVSVTMQEICILTMEKWSLE